MYVGLFTPVVVLFVPDSQNLEVLKAGQRFAKTRIEAGEVQQKEQRAKAFQR
jgi:hypothetical protein